MKPAADDIDNRRPVWEALSELFLDTELEGIEEVGGCRARGKSVRHAPGSFSRHELLGGTFHVWLWSEYNWE
jgi:hypothetical protein